jgi:hypothetical protein
MNLNQIRKLARTAGVKQVTRFRKADLVREIQRSEGNHDCFASEHHRTCGQNGCLWREDCFKLAESQPTA